MLLIYLPKITPRNRYCFKTVFKTYLKFNEYEFTTELENFLQYNGPKISYSSKPFESGIHFYASGLLEQKGIKEQNLTIDKSRELVQLFTTKQNAALPYDPFSSIFYMLSRYEEYLPHLRDKYDRFTASESLAKKEGFLQVAVVDRWVNEIKNVLETNFPELQFPKRSYRFIPTIDIDNAYAFKQKGFLRTIGSVIRTISKLDFSTLMLQLKVLSGKQSDPFDTYNYLLNLQKKFHVKPIYFFLLGDYGLNDKNLSHENSHFRSLIKSIADYAEVGIHPSYNSNKDKQKINQEIRRLEQIVKREVFRSRQHFLKLSLPETYRNLIEEDILEDYTMGFAAEPGFRAGTCTPYPFYDLDGEIECNLKVFPFQVMESTLKYYLNRSIPEAIKEIRQLIDEVKFNQGTFISLWHNESLSEEMEWKGWRFVYEELIEYAVPEAGKAS
ncbi:MAG: polysaccharide deacetylase family protein [Vicingaceae bacterium]